MADTSFAGEPALQRRVGSKPAVVQDPVKVPKVVWSSLTKTRGICAFYVVISHIWFQVWPAARPPLGYATRPDGLVGRLTSWLYHGHYAVIAFIVVSGFSLQAARLSRGGAFQTKPFLKRRCRRILPPYYAAMLISAAVGLYVVTKPAGNQWDSSIPITAQSMLTHSLLLQDVFDYTKINYAHWSIAAEFHLYLLFPLVVFALARRGIRATLAIAGAITGGLILLVMNTAPEVPAQFLGLIFYFVVGAGTATFCARRRYRISTASKTRLRLFGIAVLVLVLTVSVAIGFDNTEHYLVVFDAATAAGIALLAVSMCPVDQPTSIETPGTGSPTHSGLSTRLHHGVENMGKFSYSLYLIHAPIVAICWVIVTRFVHQNTAIFLVLLAVGSIASLALAYLFYRAFEKPFT